MFKFMSAETYKEMVDEMKIAIMATDLANYFRNRVSLIQLWHEEAFNWDDPAHRMLLKSIAMTSVDLCASAKPFNLAKTITDHLYSIYSKPQL